MLVAQNIRKNFGNLEVLKGISLSVSPSEIISIVGPSGAGKSTFLHILSSLDQPDSGHIQLDGTDIHGLKGQVLSKLRNEVFGFIFQFHNLMSELTAFENIMLPAWVGKKKAEQKANRLMDLLHISHRAGHLPSELSGGEQQRVAVARALINSPKYVFADEPSGNLDAKNAEDLHRLFFELRATFGSSFIIVTHNQLLASQSDRKITIKNGEIINQA